MRVLVTRPTDDAETIARRLAALGHEAVITPLLEIRFLDGNPLTLDGVQAILATSANGIRALARRTTRRDLPVFAVGPQTAAEAAALGFADTRSANGDAGALADATVRWARPEAGKLVHATGTQGEGRLAEALASRGFDVATFALYEVVHASSLPLEAESALRYRAVDAALFFSPRSARTIRDCVEKARLSQETPRIVAVAISQAAAAALKPLAFREIRVAATPDQDALIACLG